MGMVREPRGKETSAVGNRYKTTGEETSGQRRLGVCCSEPQMCELAITPQQIVIKNCVQQIQLPIQTPSTVTLPRTLQQCMYYTESHSLQLVKEQQYFSVCYYSLCMADR
jgi:hypothetical protein